MIRHAVTTIGFVALLLLLGKQVGTLLDDPTIWPPDDFVEYWAAAKLTLAGQNPYDPAQLLPLQQGAGRDTDEAIMMWNPPWSLTAVLPLGLLPARLAQLLWLAGGLVASAFCGDQLWRLFGGSHQQRWIGWAIGLGFLPTAFALQSGQIAPFLLLGVVLFLLFERRGWYFAAGAVTALVAIKPHLAYLLWLAILLDAVRRNCWRMVAGGVVAGVVMTAIPVLLNPHVLSQYADAMGNRPPSGWMSPTLGTLLRMAFGEERFALQFVPVAFGLAWFAWHWFAHCRTWDWGEQVPLMVLVSFVTAPYGAWPFDMMLLLPAVMRVVVKNLTPQPPSLEGKGEQALVPAPPSLRGKGVGGLGLAFWGLLAVNLACLGMNVAKTGSFYFWWVSPAVLVLYAAAARRKVGAA